MSGPFEFRQCVILHKATGSVARSLRELRDLMAVASERSLHHHLYQYFLKGNFQEYTNDFAQWAGESLEERELSEELSNIDPYEYEDINGLRAELLGVMDRYLARFPEPRGARRGDEFYFNEALTLIYPAGVWVKNLAEFLMAVKYIDASSLYYHFFDSRQRLADGSNDFSRWFLSLGKKELADTMAAIDLYVLPLEGIRERIVAAIDEEVKKDMETALVYA